MQRSIILAERKAFGELAAFIGLGHEWILESCGTMTDVKPKPQAQAYDKNMTPYRGTRH